MTDNWAELLNELENIRRRMVSTQSPAEIEALLARSSALSDVANAELRRVEVDLTISRVQLKES
jgi:hypothetical protein